MMWGIRSVPVHEMNELQKVTQLGVQKETSTFHLTADNSALTISSQDGIDGLKLHNVNGIICKEVDIHIEKIGCVTVLEGGSHMV